MRLFTADACCHSASSLSLSRRSARSSRSADGSTAGLAAAGARGGGILLLLHRRAGDAGKRVVRVELVARRGERLRGGAGDAHADDEAAEALAALRERDVVGVAGHDDDVGQVGQAEHVLDGVDGETDVGTVLGVRGGREQLHEVDRARHELRAVDGVDRRRPVGVCAREHESAEGCRVVDDRADVDRRGGQALGDLGLAGFSMIFWRSRE